MILQTASAVSFLTLALMSCQESESDCSEKESTPTNCAPLLATDTEQEQEQEQPRVLLQDLSFASGMLDYCVKEKYDALYVDELTDLDCDNAGKGSVLLLYVDLDNTGETMELGYVDSTAGIEQLTALEHLDLNGNWIQQTDLSALTQLKTLDLSNNIIDNLDVSALINLETLHVNASTTQSINVTGLTKLKTLSVDSSVRSINTYFDTYHEGSIQDLQDEEYSELLRPLIGDITMDDYFKELTIIGFSDLQNLETLIVINHDVPNVDTNVLPNLVTITIETEDHLK